MTELSERVNTPISTKELERRWAAVRAAMEAEGIDVLLMQNDNDYVGGYVKYFSDLPAVNAYPVTIVFPLDDAMTAVMHGPFGGDRELPPEGDGLLRGVGRVLTTASFASVPYSRHYDAELAARALVPYAGATIGLVGTSQISFATVDYLQRQLPGATFVEASELVDSIKSVKSEEERELIRRTAATQDAALEAAFEAVEPGKKDSEIAAVALHVTQELGSEQGFVLCASAPPGEPALFGPRHLQDRVMREGDAFSLMVETNGPGGFYTQLGRICVLGKAPQRMLEELELTLEAQRFTVDLLRPGASPKQVWEAYNAFLREHGRPEEDRLHSHGQGYDLVERPLIRFDETMPIARDMNIVCHPGYVTDGFLSWIMDNYLIGEDGTAERIHAFPQKIVEL